MFRRLAGAAIASTLMCSHPLIRPTAHGDKFDDIKHLMSHCPLSIGYTLSEEADRDTSYYAMSLDPEYQRLTSEKEQRCHVAFAGWRVKVFEENLLPLIKDELAKIIRANKSSSRFPSISVPSLDMFLVGVVDWPEDNAVTAIKKLFRNWGSTRVHVKKQTLEKLKKHDKHKVIALLDEIKAHQEQAEKYGIVSLKKYPWESGYESRLYAAVETGDIQYFIDVLCDFNQFKEFSVREGGKSLYDVALENGHVAFIPYLNLAKKVTNAFWVEAKALEDF